MIKNIFVLLTISLFIGCSSKQSFPDKKQWLKSATNAIKHPSTWIPLVGASVIAIGDWDKKISDYAREETPIFGSEQNAKDKSDTFRTASRIGMITTAIPIDDNVTFLKRMTIEHIGASAGYVVRTPLMKLTDRDRPDGNKESFPSGHATGTFSNTAMAYRNIEALNLKPGHELGLKTIQTSFSIATAWGRIEGGKHYPTDVLVGAAIGNFMALMIHDVFLDKDYLISVVPHENGGTLLVFQKHFKGTK